MPSQPLDTGWHFGPVLDLIDSDLHAASSTTPPLSPSSHSTSANKNIEHRPSERSLRLGNFGKLFEQLGISNDEPLQPVSPVDSELEEPVSSDDSLLPSLDVDVKDIQTIIDDVVNSSISTKGSTLPNGGPPKTTSSKTQTPGCKRKGKKERKVLKNAEKLLRQQELEMKGPEIPEEPHLPHETDRLDQLASGQVRAHSRSNVGAKLRPTTPVQLNTPVNVHNRPSSPAPTKEPAVISSSHPPTNVPQPASVQRLSSFAQPFTPGGNVYGLSTPQPPYPSNPSPGWVNWVPAVAPQYTTFGTSTPVHNTSSPALNDPNSYFTPQVSASAVCGHGLVPRTVQPVVLPRPQHPVTPHHQAQIPVTPSRGSGAIALRPQTDRHLIFFNQLMFNFPEDRKWLVSPMKLSNQQTSLEGIHVFVDASNIMIGFKDMLRRSGVQRFDMSFDSLALLMERRRPVAKRVFAGSHREANPLPHVSRLVETSKAVGYENNVKEQVYIRREENDRKKFFKDVDKMGWNKAMQRRSGNGSGSDSETGQAAPSTPSAPKWVEQGVDEILHLKMCQSIIDTDIPTTIVLATGDGAEAEHSDGFLAHVERALKKGWKVELVSWKQQMSGGYKNKKFRSMWGDNFRVIELDDYVESLINTP